MSMFFRNSPSLGYNVILSFTQIVHLWPLIDLSDGQCAFNTVGVFKHFLSSWHNKVYQAHLV